MCKIIVHYASPYDARARQFSDCSVKKDIIAKLNEPLFVQTARGKEYNPKQFDHSSEARITRRILNRILRLEEMVEKLEAASTLEKQAPGLNPLSGDTQPTDLPHSHDVRESETIDNPQHSDPAESAIPECEHKGETSLLSLENQRHLEAGEVLLPDGKMLSFRLIDPATGKESQDKVHLIVLSEYPASE